MRKNKQGSSAFGFFYSPLFTVFIMLVGSVSVIYGQGDEAAAGTVPDLTGLNVPQAAAILNRAGYALGNEFSETWTAESAAPENTIGSQSVAAGTAAEPGTAVDVTVLRTPNVTLIYDDNDLTMVNRSGERINLNGIAFNTIEGNNQAKFQARRWSNVLRENQCMQLWSVSRNGPKGMADCNFIQNWLTTNNRNDHFWTRASGAQRFAVLEEEVERAVCDAAPPNSQDNPITCTFYLPTGGQSEFTAFIYLAYNAENLIVYNRSEAQWMQINQTTFHNPLPSPGTLGANFRINARLLGDPQTVARIGRLAPGQCILFTVEGAFGGAVPPQACFPIVTHTLPAAEAFWSQNFEVEGQDAKRRMCNTFTPDRLTICIMPR